MIEPGTTVDLEQLDARDSSAAPGNKAATGAVTTALKAQLGVLQEQLWANRRQRILVVLQGMDTSGKGGAIKHVLSAVNPAGLRVATFKAPTAPELGRDYLWRVHAQVPMAGEIGVFDRSHYEDVLVPVVNKTLTPAETLRRYHHINAFEQMLTDEGTTIVKVMLHISHAEQRERLQARLDDPTKQWKFNAGDLTVRAQWDDYQAAYNSLLTATSTQHAPWHVIPADRKWYRNWALAAILTDTIAELGLVWPTAQADHITIT